jgi:hypothetical protein
MPRQRGGSTAQDSGKGRTAEEAGALAGRSGALALAVAAAAAAEAALRRLRVAMRASAQRAA